jgi:hypothetical protein
MSTNPFTGNPLPTPLSIETPVAFCVCHCNLRLAPASTGFGEAVNDNICGLLGALTPTVRSRSTSHVPLVLLASRRYTVVDGGLTTKLPLGPEDSVAPFEVSMSATLAAFEVLHVMVDVAHPVVMLEGLADSELIVGHVPIFTVTCD